MGEVLMIRYALLITLTYSLMSCSSTPCREPVAPPALQAQRQIEAEKQAKEEESKKVSTIKVAKSDGSKQCVAGGIELETAAKELKGIKIISQKKQNDGMMRIQVCGSDTGMHNVFEIEKKDLAIAIKAGFKEWTR